MARRSIWMLAALTACGAKQSAQAPRYVDAKLCASCHADIARTYRETGMARAFQAPSAANVTEGRFAHKASGRTYTIAARGGRYFLERAEAGGIEREIHYVMGSGNHARTFIHRTPENRLIELPLGWYAEGGLAMSPGYDRPNHPEFTRKIGYDCMFCHNAYPDLPEAATLAGADPAYPAALPMGIDCQRCHGPGGAHVDAMGRGPIVNPAKLAGERKMEVCMQCHLETTSGPLPNSIVKFDRGAFSYSPAEPLGAFVTHFDHAKGAGREGKFEIVNSVYRLRQSRCFLSGGAALTCTTCHNPHSIPRGEAAVKAFDVACVKCHATVAAHDVKTNCAGCHMPKRRAEDVIHAVMTDHLIQRKPAAGLTAGLAERREIEGQGYQGEVALYYPASVADDLYTAAAQVMQKSNLAAGLPRFEAAIAKHRPKQAAFYFNLAQGYLAAGRRDKAIEWYRAALGQDAAFVPAIRSLGAALRESGGVGGAVAALKSPGARDAGLLDELAQAYGAAGDTASARAALEEALRAEPEYVEARNRLGGLLFRLGHAAKAESELREAVRFKPDYAEARNNLGNVLAARGDVGGAEAEYRAALEANPKLAPARLGLAGVLARRGRFAEAEREAALAHDSAEARELLGNLRAHRGAWAAAAESYRDALRIKPGWARAELGLGTALAALGDRAGAAEHLRKAAMGGESEAAELLKQLRE